MIMMIVIMAVMMMIVIMVVMMMIVIMVVMMMIVVVVVMMSGDSGDGGSDSGVDVADHDNDDVDVEV